MVVVAIGGWIEVEEKPRNCEENKGNCNFIYIIFFTLRKSEAHMIRFTFVKIQTNWYNIIFDILLSELLRVYKLF